MYINLICLCLALITQYLSYPSTCPICGLIIVNVPTSPTSSGNSFHFPVTLCVKNMPFSSTLNLSPLALKFQFWTLLPWEKQTVTIYSRYVPQNFINFCQATLQPPLLWEKISQPIQALVLFQDLKDRHIAVNQILHPL